MPEKPLSHLDQLSSQSQPEISGRSSNSSSSMTSTFQCHPRTTLALQHEGSTINIPPMCEIPNTTRNRNYPWKPKEFKNLLSHELQRDQIGLRRIESTSTSYSKNETSIVSHARQTENTTIYQSTITELRFDLIPRRGYVGSSNYELSHP